MYDYEELNCNECGQHLGYLIYTGPIGLCICDDCKEKEEQMEKEDE